jgi:serine protease Do
MHQPGQSVALDVMRYGTKKTFEVKLTEAPTDEQIAANDAGTQKPSAGISADKLGIDVEPVSDDMAREASIPDADRGLRVADVAGAGPAHDKLVPNDIIVAVLYPEPRQNVHTVVDLQTALSKVHTGDYVSLLVYSPGPQGQTGGTRVVSLHVGE